MSFVEISEVELSGLTNERLLGGAIDTPKAGVQCAANEIDVLGWVLGRETAAVAVEIVHEGAVVRRTPINLHRPDVAAAYPGVVGAEFSGFRTILSVSGINPLELGLRAVLRDQSRIPMGAIRARWSRHVSDCCDEASLVSVIIPCYNQAHFLGEAIESVLAQTYPYFEIVVVDDGSRDNTSEVAARYPGVRCIRQDNQGLAAARNTGLQYSNGSLLVFLDADDRLLSEALEIGLETLQAHPGCAFVSGHCNFIAQDGAFLWTAAPRQIGGDLYQDLLSRSHFIIPGAVMYRRSVFESVKGFDSSLDACADYDLYFRIAMKFSVYCHDRLVLEHRRHSQNMTLNADLMLDSTMRLLRAQRHYIKSNRRYLKAYKKGIKHGTREYGKPLAEQLPGFLMRREWKRLVRGALLLMRYYPRGYRNVFRAWIHTSELWKSSLT